MNYGGQPLLSRQTIPLGRGVMVLSLAVTLTVKYEIKTEKLELFGVVLGEKDLSGPIIWTLGTLVAFFFVIWIRDEISLNFFSFSVRKKTKGRLCDDGSDELSHLEAVLMKLNLYLKNFDENGSELEATAKRLSQEIRPICDELNEVRKSAKWYCGYAPIYVAFWSLVVPMILAGYAAYLVHHA